MCNKQENDVDEIIPNLWLGNVKTAYNYPFLKNNNIKYVLTIMDSFDTSNMYDDISYLILPIKDENACAKNMIHIFNIATNFILEALKSKNKILIHCKRGHHRSASIVAAFLIKYVNFSFNDAIKYIHTIRPCALVRETCMTKNLEAYYNYIKQ